MRPQIVGPEQPETPFPIVVDTYITAGFGRGSAELGIPTANISPELLESLDPGVYYGWASVAPTANCDKTSVDTSIGRDVHFNYGEDLGQTALQPLPMVMSIGWNPFYNNEKKSAEVHICHKFNGNFYGARIKVAVLGWIRAEQNYDSLDALIEDIQTDIKVALNSLERPAYERAKKLVE